MRVLAVYDISLSVEKPVGNFILSGILENGDDTFKFFCGKFPSTKCQNVERLFNEPFVEINVRLLVSLWESELYFLDNNVRVSSANTLDFSQCKHDFVFAIDIRVEQTENVLECILVGDYESHCECQTGWI